MNAAGLQSKLFTLNKAIKELKPSVFFIEETKCRLPGKIKVDNFIIFELVRQSKVGGGGLALGVIEDLKPVLVQEGNDMTEALSVEISVKELTIRCCVAYGPQENDKVERKN